MSSSGGATLFSQRILFDESLKSYLYILCRFIDDQHQKYRQARSTILDQKKSSNENKQEENKWKQRSVAQAKQLYDKMRGQYLVTKENLPPVLKEVFDAFVEVHSRKSYLVTRRLVNDEKKKMVVKAVLDCCAMCGPDAMNFGVQPEKNKGGKTNINKGNSAKFLDLAKLSEPEYQTEGLKIAVYWYLDVLEKVHVKRNVD